MRSAYMSTEEKLGDVAWEAGQLLGHVQTHHLTAKVEDELEQLRSALSKAAGHARAAAALDKDYRRSQRGA